MRIHRFYAPDTKLKADFWLHDKDLLHQWNRVLRFKPGQQAALFDGQTTDRLYEIVELSQTEAHLKMKTEMARKLPKKHIYLFWSLLKSGKNELVIQKCTELGVSNFVPVISGRSIRKDFNQKRAAKIAVEASEQCGRSDIPMIREPLKLETAVGEYKNKIKLVFCDEQGEDMADPTLEASEKIGIFIGPEGGWSEEEIKLFAAGGAKCLNLHDLTLRAETAAAAAVAKIY
jgi:16S rRNA (uracil1498-N3)-methyltransferase